MWDQLDEITRTRIKMALLALVILMFGVIVMLRLGGRWVRRVNAQDVETPPREPRTFLKPLTEEEARNAVPIPRSLRSDADDAGKRDDGASDSSDAAE